MTGGPIEEWWDTTVATVRARLDAGAAPREVLVELTHRCVSLVGAAEGSVLVASEGDEELTFLASASPAADKLAGARVPIGSSLVGFVFLTGQSLGVADVKSDERHYAKIDELAGTSTRTMLAVPLRRGDRILGVATYVNRHGEAPFRPFDLDETRRALRLAALTAIVLEYEDGARRLATWARGALAAAGEAGGAGPLGARERAFLEMTSLSTDEQELCADLVSLVARRRGSNA